MELLNEMEYSYENENLKNSSVLFMGAAQDCDQLNTDTDNVILFLANLSEVSDNNIGSNNTNATKSDVDCKEIAKDVSQNSYGSRLRNPLGLTLLISTDDKTESVVNAKDPVVWNSEGPEDSSPCSPVSAVSGFSTGSADDSGFSSDENRSNNKMFKLARTKSLRSALRSPAHVGKRKTVRFADSLGLDLEQKTYFESDDRENELYNFKTPFFFTENQNKLRSKVVSLSAVDIPNRSAAEISHRTRTHCVCLNSISITDTNVSGVIHVLNLACDKQVCVRYTSDGWSSFSEARAIFTRSVGSDGAVDSFSFFIALPSDTPAGAICEFCIRYTVNNNSYWDNNSDQNYKLQCVEQLGDDLVAQTVKKPTVGKNLWERKSEYGGFGKSFLDYEDDDDEEFYYYTPSYNFNSSRKGYFEQRFGCSYGDHLRF